jgi:Protein of unknown function (DUF2806)
VALSNPKGAFGESQSGATNTAAARFIRSKPRWDFNVVNDIETNGEQAMVEIKPALANVDKMNIDLSKAPKETRKIVETLAAYIAPDRHRRLREIEVETEVKKRRLEAEARVADAKADVDVELTRARGEVQKNLILAEGDFILFEQAVERLGFRELEHQRILVEILRKLIALAPRRLSEEPVGKQFIFDAIDNSQDTTNEGMQQLWAELIAEEFAKPGSFSPKTLSVMKSLRREDAELFATYCRFAWGFPEEAHKFVPNVQSLVHSDGFFDASIPRAVPNIYQDLVESEVSYFRRVQLESLGLIKLNPHSQGVNWRLSREDPLTLHFHGRPYTIRIKAEQQVKPLVFTADYFTPAGNELYSLCQAQPHEEFRKQFLATIRHLGFEIDE